MNEKQIKHMVYQFLGWKLPSDFSPDNGIKFEPSFLPGVGFSSVVGTNLLTATQAEEMVRHLIAGLPED